MDSYYQRELSVLREDAQAFGRRYPALAPMMQPGADPDVERILEGVAYLCGRVGNGWIRRPGTAPDAAATDLPHAVLPTPSTTLMAFTPRQDLREPLHLPRGTELASRPVDGVPCIYTLDAEADVLPLHIRGTTCERRNETSLVLSLHLQGSVPLSSLRGMPLRLYLAAPYAEAVQQYHALRQGLRRVEAVTGHAVQTLPADALQPLSVPSHDGRLAAGRGLARAYMALHRYFLQPQQLLFFHLQGLERLTLPSDAVACELRFHLQGEAVRNVQFREDAFQLNVFPASNICRVSSEPVNVTIRRKSTSCARRTACAARWTSFSVEQATALFPGGRTETFTSFEAGDPQRAGGLYQIRCRLSPVSGEPEHLIMPLYRRDAVMDTQPFTLALHLRCCNTAQPARLQVGDICEATDSSPSLASFRNILAPTPRCRARGTSRCSGASWATSMPTCSRWPRRRPCAACSPSICRRRRALPNSSWPTVAAATP